MTKARDIADLLDANGDVVSSALDNVPPSNDASALTTGTIDNARISLDANEIPNLDTSKITTGTFNDARMPSTVLNSNVDLTNLSASNLTSGTLPDARFPATLPAISGANLTNLPSTAGFVKLSHNALTSNSAIIVFDGLFSSDYLSYKIVGNLKFTSNARLLSRWYIGNAEDSTNAYNTIGRVSNMHYDGSGIYPDLRSNGGFNYTNHTYDFFDFGKDYNTNGKWYGTRTASDSAGYLIDCTISDPQNSSRNKMIFLNACWQVEGGNSIDGTTQNRTNQSSSLSASGSFYSTSVCTGICFIPSAGNFSSGSYLTLYGLAK